MCGCLDRDEKASIIRGTCYCTFDRVLLYFTIIMMGTLNLIRCWERDLRFTQSIWHYSIFECPILPKFSIYFSFSSSLQSADA